MLSETYTLSHGIKIPKLGLGTWMIPDSQAAEAVKAAIALGYRLIDTAQAYENETGVGDGVRSSGVPREELFVTSKVAAEIKSYEATARSIDETLARMKLDYIDMMIIHSPQPWVEWRSGRRFFAENKNVWRALEDAHASGIVKAIGVSNFLRDDLDNILEDCRVRPMVNQILLHISNTNMPLINYCKEKDILVEAYSPIAHGVALHNKEITAIAQKYNVSVAALCIRYVIELGTVALPKTSNPEHMAENAKVDFHIEPDDMQALTELAPIKDYAEFSAFPVFSLK